MKRVMFALPVLVFAFSLLSSTISFAADYTITIDETNMSRNQSMIFSEVNIGPGFEKTYNVRFDNQSSSPVLITLQKVAEAPSNTMSLNEIELVFSHDGTVLTGVSDGMTNVELICISAKTKNLITLDASMDYELGNEWQDKTFWVDMTFRGDATDCDESGWTPDLPGLPNTGEDRSFFYFLIGTTILFTITTIVFLIIFIVAKKRGNKDQRYEKNSL